MRFRRPFRNLALGLALAAAFAAPAAADTLPRLEADSLGGTHVVLPDDAAGKPLVLLLAFTKESQSQLKAWSKRMLADHVGSSASVYIVVVADKIAFLSRKHIRSMVEGSAVGSQDQINHDVLITFQGDGWRALTPPGDKHTAGVVVCDANGAIVFARREAYDDANVAELEKAAK